jgi:hypothetical protein
MHYYMHDYSTYYSTYYAILNYFNILCAIIFPILHYYLKCNIFFSLFYGVYAQFISKPSHEVWSLISTNR